MQAIVLAGGTGDRLWPLSRRNYPKQFLKFNHTNSLFQETISRNIPFCSAFLVVASAAHEEIVEGQMMQFAGIPYRFVAETRSYGTAAALLLALSQLSDEEMVLVVPSDLAISDAGYADAILCAQRLAGVEQIVLFGIPATDPETSFGYIRYKDDTVTRFIEKPSQALADKLFYQDDVLWNSGMLLANASLLRRELEDALASYGLILEEGTLHAEREVKQRLSMEKLLLEGSDHLRVCKLGAMWEDVSRLSSYEKVARLSEERVILSNCTDTSVISDAKDRLIVGNGLSNLYIVDTPDALYITDKTAASEIKDIIKDAPESARPYIDYSKRTYRSWGLREIIAQAPGYRVRRLVIYPGASLSLHSHEMRNENYSVIRGVLSMDLDGKQVTIGERESINVLPRQMHRLYNAGDEDLVLIEVDTGAEIDERDMLHADQKEENSVPVLYRLSPAYKDYLWGGQRLVDQFHKDSPYEITAESWELSAHPDGSSVIASGEFEGTTFSDFVKKEGAAVCGWKSRIYDRFPILIKFIDAASPLSVQIHPDDDYAFLHEKEFGKNEMWYVMDAVDGAYLYCGFSRDVSAEEVRKALLNGTITDLLNKVYVKKGDVIFIPAGTIHAIGAGLLICEIQQSSNSTYRIYDYDRVDANGNHRELHIDKAFDVMTFGAYRQGAYGLQPARKEGENIIQQLCLCKYFHCDRYAIEKKQSIYVDASSFVSLVILSGEGSISCDGEREEFHAGDSIFIAAGRRVVHVEGNCELIATRI